MPTENLLPRSFAAFYVSSIFVHTTSSRTSSFPSKYHRRERIHKFPIGRLPPSMVGNHWLRTCPPLFCLPLSQFFVFCFEGATATAGKSDHALTCYVMVQLRLCCNYRTYLGLTNCIKPSELSLFCCYFQGILAGSFTPEISLRNSCCRISPGKTH